MTIPHGPLSSANFIQHMARNTSDKRVAQALTAMSVLLIGLMIYREVKDMTHEKRGCMDRVQRPQRHPHDFEHHGHHSHVERLEQERGHHHGHAR